MPRCFPGQVHAPKRVDASADAPPTAAHSAADHPRRCARPGLSENADNARARAEAVEEAIRDLGSVPEVIGPSSVAPPRRSRRWPNQAQPFDEALLGDLAPEHQLLDRARYIQVLATAAQLPEVVALADRLITAHSTTVDWLTTVLAGPGF